MTIGWAIIIVCGFGLFFVPARVLKTAAKRFAVVAAVVIGCAAALYAYKAREDQAQWKVMWAHGAETCRSARDANATGWRGQSYGEGYEECKLMAIWAFNSTGATQPAFRECITQHGSKAPTGNPNDAWACLDTVDRGEAK